MVRKYLVQGICTATDRNLPWLSLRALIWQPAPAMRGTYQTWKDRSFRQTCPDAGRVLHQSLQFSARTYPPMQRGYLEERKAELLEENSAFETINGALCNQLTQVNEELHSSEEELSQSRQEADKAKKQADKYQKRIDELAPKVKNMERLAAEFSANPEELLPESAIMETGKAYREKKAKPLVEKIVKVLRSVYSAFLDLSNRFERLQESYSRERGRNEHLTGKLQEMIDESRELREVAADMECVKAVLGSQKVEEAISQAKRQEKIERERKQTMKKKYDREAI